MRYSHSLPPPSSDLNEVCEKNKEAGRKEQMEVANVFFFSPSFLP